MPATAWAADAAKPADAKSTATKPADAKSSTNSTAGSATAQDAGASFQTDNYRLRPTDKININVVDDAAATHNYQISVDGTVQLIYLDSAPPLKLSGLTLMDAKQAIIKAYVDNKIFIKPSITLEVTDFSARRVNVFGQVAKPGAVYFPPEKDLTLVTAIADAGGPTEKAAATVTITRINPDGTTKVLENVDLYGATKDAKKDILLQEGDTITLGESAFADVWHH
ncbi:MAG TPA: polysaccharide biosynthesis/export family protein [Opitutales bacterium]|nr:polysaccharide biosynthesis/export family protein [Opitutales bacterium]